MSNDYDVIKSKKLFLLDMDGTLYLEHRLFDGTLAFLNELKKQGKRGIYITNNSSKSVKDYVLKLQQLGIDAIDKDFYTSSMATAHYLNEVYPGKIVYCMGTESLKTELRNEGIKIAKDKDDSVDVVLLGFDTELTHQKLRDVCWLLQKDLPYLATNPDYVCPVEFGYVPDCGSFAEMIHHATKKKPLFIGKPNPRMIEYAIQEANLTKEETVVIGDRIYTDVLSGKNAGVTTICVLSGETTIEDIHQSEVTPDFVIPTIQDIYNIIKD